MQIDIESHCEGVWIVPLSSMLLLFFWAVQRISAFFRRRGKVAFAALCPEVHAGLGCG